MRRESMRILEKVTQIGVSAPSFKEDIKKHIPIFVSSHHANKEKMDLLYMNHPSNTSIEREVKIEQEIAY